MRRLSLFAVVIAAFMLAGCAAGIRGGVVDPASEEAVPEPTGTQFVYDGERGTVQGVEWPEYFVSTVRFGDISIHPITYPGWSVDRLDRTIVMRNGELQAVIIISWAQYPDLEVMRQSRLARGAGMTVTDVVIGADARMTSHFGYSRADVPVEELRTGHMYGLYTDYSDRTSGAVLIGHWPAEHDDVLAPQMERIARNLVFRDCRGSRANR